MPERASVKYSENSKMIPAQLMQKVGHLDFVLLRNLLMGRSCRPGSSQVPLSGSSPDRLGPSGRVRAFVRGDKGSFTTKLPMY